MNPEKPRSQNVLKKMLRSKRGYSVGFGWIFGLVSLFGLGVIYVVFNQVLTAYVVPTMINQINGTNSNIPLATQTTIITNIDRYMTYFNFLPFLLFVIIIIYMIVLAIRQERTEY